MTRAFFTALMSWTMLFPLTAAAQTAGDALTASKFQGGLIVHVGCGDVNRTVELRTGDNTLVQGLDVSAEKVRAARAVIAERKLTGDVTAREFDGTNLPFADGMVNLLVVDSPFSVAPEEMMRVLCPRGVLCVADGGTWKTRTKPWPADLDEWTHYQHDPQGTMVGLDKVVGPPRRIQWMGDPKWLRNHDFMSSMHAMVSAGGRIFYIIDEGLRAHVFLPPHWTLIARDAFNGAVLWRRPVKDWNPSNWPLKSGPGQMPRRLVAVGDRVYVTLGYTEPATEIDAATGKTLRTYDQSKSTEEIVCADGVLFLLVDPTKKPVGYRAKTATYSEIGYAGSTWAWTPQSPPRNILALESETGKLLWKHTDRVAPLTLTVGGGRVFYANGDRTIALDRQTGKPAWSSPGPTIKSVPTGGAMRSVYSDGVLVVANGTKMTAFSAEGGKPLWTGSLLASSHHCPNDLFVINGLIWSAHTGTAQKQGTHYTAVDLHTGETKKDLVAQNPPAFPMHPRCYPSRATTEYIMTNGIGTEFYVPGDNKLDIYNYVRGSCIYGVMPCNGLLYKPPDSCACYYMSKLEYLCALAPAAKGTSRPVPDDRRLEKGPAYAEVSGGKAGAVAADDWPMYRHDDARSGFCPSAAPADLKKAWEVNLGGQLTQPIIAGGRVYVASVDAHTLHALDAATGSEAWTFIAGGRIDSSPTVCGVAVLFGSADGWVYCLRAADGALAWRYLVAPEDRQILSCQRLESTWPLNGSVLVHGETVYALAGRNMFFDGGMRLVRLNAATGQKLSENVLNELDPTTGKNLQTLIVGKSMPVANSDVLSSDGKHVYMGAQRFDLEGKRLEIASVSSKAATPPAGSRHLFCSTGFLDDLWFHRSYWTYGESFPEGWSEYSIAQRRYPSGRIMAIGKGRAYGFRADNLGNTLHPTPLYRLYAADTTIQTAVAAEPAPAKATDKGKKKRRGEAGEAGIAGGYKVLWQVPSPPLLVNAMALGTKQLFIAGPPDVADETKMLGFLPGANDEANRQLQAQDDAWRGKKGALLWVVSVDDGRKLAEYKLEALPVWDGMALAGGKVFVSLKNGAVTCWGAK